MTTNASQTISTDEAPATPLPTDAERIARAALSRVLDPGDQVAAPLAGADAQELWELLQAGGPLFARWEPRVTQARPEDDLERAAEADMRFVIPGDDEWPDQLQVLARNPDGGVPYGLWVRGPASLRETLAKSIAIVGARASSSYGEHVTGEIAGGLADEGVTVVSGGAYGIDAAAHRGALASGGATVAVLACGADVSYPKSNAALFDRIAQSGLLISELPPRCSPTKLRFLARNRLIAASTRGTVVTEAAIRSGALNSAGWAKRCGRPVMGVPGPITSRLSEGVHRLIRDGGAHLVNTVADVLDSVAAEEADDVVPPM
jgi:DNA processing protein